MHSAKTLLIAAALAGTSLSQKSDSPACSSALSVFQDLFSVVPATPTEILSFIAEHTEIPVFTPLDARSHQSQLCAVAAALPSSLLPELQTLGAQLMEFAHSYEPEFSEYITACVDDDLVPASASYFSHVLSATGNICTEFATETATPTPTPAPGSGSGYPTITAAPGSTFTTSVKPSGGACRRH